MADVDHADAARLDHLDQPEQRAHFALGKRRRRLVHQQQLRLDVQRFRQLDHLLLGDAQVGDPRVRVEVQAEQLQDFLRLAAHLAPVDQRQMAQSRLGAEKDVLGDASLRAAG